MTDTDRDWADNFADELLDSIIVDRDMQRRILATRLRTLKIKAQSESLQEATEKVKEAFDKHGIGGGDK